MRSFNLLYVLAGLSMIAADASPSSQPALLGASKAPPGHGAALSTNQPGRPQNTVRPVVGTNAPMSETDCEGLGGKVAPIYYKACKSEKACWLTDANGVVRGVCITNK